MPYHTKKDFLFSKRTFRKSKSRKSVDKRQDRQIMKLSKLVRFSKERKFIDQQLQTSIGTSWQGVFTRPLTYIAQGNGETQRIGNKLLIHRIQFKTHVTAGDTTNLYRILIVRFGHCPTTALGIQNVLQNYNNTTPFQIMSFKKRNAPSKYSILWDSGVRSTVGNGATADSPYGPRSVANHNITKSFPKGLLVQYSTNTASSETNGFIYVVACTDSALAPNIGLQSMVRVIYSG